MRPSDPAPRALAPDLVDELREIAAAHGITHTGVAPATVMTRARAALVERHAAGLDDTMAFTYKNPERSTDPRRAVRNAQALFVGARPYRSVEPDGPIGVEMSGRVARYSWADHYEPLREGLRAVAGRLRRDRWKAVAFADDNSVVDREAAHLAGLGWYGKNANLLLPGAGSWFVLGSVVTDAPLPVASGVVADGCGSCRRCLDACPTGAIVQPGVVDARRCLSWLLQKPGIFDRALRQAVGDRMYGCDDCQEVCPPSVRSSRHEEPSTPGEPETHVDVLALLDADDDDVLRRWERWYISDRDPRWLRRNALIVIGNSGVRSARVRAVLERYLAADDPVLRAHAVWAARRCDLDDLLPESDPHPDVRLELTAAL
ncbi:MAG: tRNA epoxyqueuosine(34) reductase QueG [Ilumatobacteraceae bacterium]